MHKIALRWVGVAVLCTLVFMGVGIGLGRWRQALQTEATPVSINIGDASVSQLAAIAVKFDANGIGTQVIDGTALTFRLLPYPPKANAPSTLTLIPLNTKTNITSPISPTLYITPADSTVAREYPIQRQPDGSYRVIDLVFSQPGQWRLRLNFALNGQSDYGVLIALTIDN